MRIGIFTECYHPTLNGVVVSIDTFRQVLEKRGHEYFIFAPETKGWQDYSPDHVFRYPSVAWPEKDYPIALPFLAPSQTARIQDLKLDVIHTQHLFTMGRLGLQMGRRLGIPVVHTYHTLITEYTHYLPRIPGLRKLARKFVVGISRNYCNNCDQIVTPSPSMKKVLRSYGVKTPIESISTGVNLDDFKDPYDKGYLETKWHIPENQKLLLYVSRVAKEKNLDFLFGAIKILLRRQTDFHLLIVGGGPELKYYQRKVRDWEIEKFVTFTGKQEKAITNRFFGAADVFVFPSITETQGIVITEAMAAGIPAVAVNIMGPSNIIENNEDGFLTPLNIKEFSAKIEELLENANLRKKFGRQAQKNAQKFSTLACAFQMENLYERNRYHSR